MKKYCVREYIYSHLEVWLGHFVFVLLKNNAVEYIYSYIIKFIIQSHVNSYHYNDEGNKQLIKYSTLFKLKGLYGLVIRNFFCAEEIESFMFTKLHSAVMYD